MCWGTGRMGRTELPSGKVTEMLTGVVAVQVAVRAFSSLVRPPPAAIARNTSLPRAGMSLCVSRLVVCGGAVVMVGGGGARGRGIAAAVLGIGTGASDRLVPHPIGAIGDE